MEIEMIWVFWDVTLETEFTDDEILMMLKERSFDVGRLID